MGPHEQKRVMTEHHLNPRGTLIPQTANSQTNSLANSRGTEHRTVHRHVSPNSRDHRNRPVISRKFPRRTDGFGADQIVLILRVQEPLDFPRRSRGIATFLQGEEINVFSRGDGRFEFGAKKAGFPAVEGEDDDLEGMAGKRSHGDGDARLEGKGGSTRGEGVPSPCGGC